MRRCVYTALIGGYEQLNDQPVALLSEIPFICLTDDPELKSTTWEIRYTPRMLPLDSVRSQRAMKIRPDVYLPEFDASLYIDNTILLSQTPELIFESYFSAGGFSVPSHSYRESVLDEFEAVAQGCLDHPSRLIEALERYKLICPEVLFEKPYWAAILIRDHRHPLIHGINEFWLSQVLQYSRRDQLSLNRTFKEFGYSPKTIPIDNHQSWFHSWPHLSNRRGDISKFHEETSPNTMKDLLRQLISSVKV
jgi:hypothetical protein